MDSFKGEKMKEFSKFTILLFLLFSNIFVFSEVAINQKNLLESIYEGKDFTNVFPYPIYDEAYSGFEPYFIYWDIDPIWLISGIYKTNWSDFERGLYLSDSIPYVKGFMGGYDAGNMRIISGLYFFDPYLDEELFLIQKNTSYDRNSDRHRIENFGYSDPSKTLFIHRVEWIFFEKLRLSLSELNLIGGKYPDLSDANPFGVSHNNLGEGFSNSMLGLDFSLIPFDGFQIYGQFAMDDFVVQSTESGAEDYKPTALAWSFGTRKVYKSSNFYVSPKIEYYKIYTWMYNQWLPYLKWTALYGNEELPIGFDYGNDMEGFLIGIDIFNDNVSYKLIFERYLKGEIDLSTPYEDERKIDSSQWAGPYGETSNFIVISFQFEIKI